MFINNSFIIVGYAALALLIYILIAFLVGTIKKNNGIMDIFYGPAYFVVAFTSFYFYFLLNETFLLRQLIVTILVLLWSIRLATYVYIRNRGKPEDRRYARIRERWKESGKNVALRSLAKIYLFQGLVVFIVAFSVLWTNIIESPQVDNLIDFTGLTLWIGTLIWIIGFYFETFGDYQLYKFLNNPNRTKKVMDEGLWKYTQHPNYFGETTMWWGIFVIALGVPWGVITIFAPVYITFQIINVSGVRLLNKIHEGDDEFAEYRRRTSTFIPWFPKKKK
jgi:steroid 5-alpha reductase family enzyme